jgi:transcriptional regulator of acetoin/glycerol metabolism
MTTAPIELPDHDGHRSSGEPVSLLSVVLDCDRPRAGGENFSLEGVSRLMIGRGDRRAFCREGPEWTLQLPDARVSASHAELVRVEAHQYQLRDLESRNGTFLHGQRITSTRLTDGDVLLLGHTLLMFHSGPARCTANAAPGLPPALRTLCGHYAHRLDNLQRVAPSELPILFLGESGTGKELLARATHDLSRRTGAFVPVNCAALPSTLTESLLFGHTRGAFSGAVKDEPGHVRAADRGTLFLDEVADLPLASQGTLLRVLQEQEVTPVGAARPQHVDVRFVTATHRDLNGMVARGEFRQDLYARLAGFVFKVPPLRDRRVDLGLILSCLPSADFKLRPEVAAALMTYDWPLNIRELGHCLTSAALLCSQGAIGLADLPDAVRSSAPPAVPRTPPPPPPPFSPADCALRDDLEKRLAAHSGNIAAVARDLGKARQQVYRWIRRFGLLRPTEPPSKLDDRE